MKVKTHTLSKHVLDWAVAKAMGLQLHKNAILNGAVMRGWWISGLSNDPNVWRSLRNFRPSVCWLTAGPIIESNRICVDKPEMSNQWIADIRSGPNRITRTYGETLLIAAMRCYVTSKLGEEVEIPDELFN